MRVSAQLDHATSEGRFHIVHAHKDRLELTVVFNRRLGVLAPHTGVFGSPKGCLDRRVVVGVDETGARLESGRHPVRTRQVAGKDPCRQTEFGIIGPHHDLGLVLEIQHRHHWAEDLLARDHHVIGHIGKDGGLQIEALPVDPLAAGNKARTLGLTFLDVAQRDIHLPL